MTTITEMQRILKYHALDKLLVSGDVYLARDLPHVLGCSRNTLYKMLKRYGVRRVVVRGMTMFAEAELKDKLWDTEWGKKKRKLGNIPFWNENFHIKAA